LIIDGYQNWSWGKDWSYEYPSGNSITCKKEGDNFVFDYSSKGRNVRLNDFLNPEWRFVPVAGKFSASLGGGQEKLFYPEVHLCVSCESGGGGDLRDEITILAALHEIGHARFFELLCDVVKSHDVLSTEDLASVVKFSYEESHSRPTPRLNGSFCDNLRSAYEYTSLIPNYERFDERFAWAFALNTVRKLQLLTQFDITDFRNYYIPCLRSYGDSCIRDRFKSYTRADSPNPWNSRTESRSWLKRPADTKNLPTKPLNNLNL